MMQGHEKQPSHSFEASYRITNCTEYCGTINPERLMQGLKKLKPFWDQRFSGLHFSVDNLPMVLHSTPI